MLHLENPVEMYRQLHVLRTSMLHAPCGQARCCRVATGWPMAAKKGRKKPYISDLVCALGPSGAFRPDVIATSAWESMDAEQ
jgi:hypothetical protein